jgi:glycosyltransferase involved in cell wall biosynthesis
VRIAVATAYLHHVGGVETYLSCVLPELSTRGHEVSVWYEVDPPSPPPRLINDGLPCVKIGSERERPDVIFLHGLLSVASESRLTDLSPVVRMVHGYSGMCISGTKHHAFPQSAVCTRPFGPACLLYYLPRRCGGGSPLTMLTAYSHETRRRQVLQANTCVTLSEHMRAECIAQGVDPSRVTCLPAFAPASNPQIRSAGSPPWHLLFAGRMERLKGGQVLLDAIASLNPALRSDIRLTFAGNGRERHEWQRLAERVSGTQIQFVGELSPAERDALFASVNLLVVPSLWPEPLGFIGLEAAAAGVPAVAFDVGGIHEWLKDDVTGRIVRGRPTARSLGAAIEDCLSNPDRLRAWGIAALAASRCLSLSDHLLALEAVLLRAAGVDLAASAVAVAHA